MFVLPFNYEGPFDNSEKDRLELAMQALKELFDFRLSIRGEDKARLHTLGKSNFDWVDKCLSYVKDEPLHLSRALTYEEFQTFFDGRQEVRDFLSRIVPLVQDIKDTMDYMGHMCMAYGFDYYNGVKTGVEWNRHGAKAIQDDLAARFSSQGPGNSADTTSDTSEESDSEAVAPQELLTRLAENLARDRAQNGNSENIANQNEGGTANDE